MKKILDVGGSVNTYPGTTHVIDLSAPKDEKIEFCNMDICSGKWPYPDKYFDFVNCAETLEDVKDPIFICKELMRVAKSGRITVPHFTTELTRGIDPWPGADKYVGYTHHRWIVIFKDNILTFIPKWASVHTVDWVEHTPGAPLQRFELKWEGTFNFEEKQFFSWFKYYNYIAELVGVEDAETKWDLVHYIENGRDIMRRRQ